MTGEGSRPGRGDGAENPDARDEHAIGHDLRSGLWLKDEGAFINVRAAQQANHLEGVLIYDFDADYRLRKLTSAQVADYAGNGVWTMTKVTETQFSADGPRTTRNDKAQWRSRVSPELLDALIVRPERMSAWALYKYTEHLVSNKQKTERHEIALWKKLFYPLATLVMMALALPFAYMQGRAGMVGVKVFSAHAGHFFHMLKTCFSQSGCCRTGRGDCAVLPRRRLLLAAMLMMWWVERR